MTSMNDINQVVEFLINATYKKLKERTGRTPGISRVFMVIFVIVTNNYENCLNQFLETENVNEDVR